MARGGNIPETELFWSLIDKADRKFARVRDTPMYGRDRNDAEFHKAFKIYTRLWKMQQENRQKLVEAGMKRWEIGEIASRIARLYYGQYQRTSESSYLAEAYIFYEAILSREYFRDSLSQDASALAKKQLRFLARFLIVCLVLNRREMVVRLANQLRSLLEECKRNFQEAEFKEWKQIVQEISRFLKVDTNFMNMRPLRYSYVFDSPPGSLPCISNQKGLKLRDAILVSYHHNEVKFTELTLDTFRMLQCLEWEPLGSFSLTNGDDANQEGSSHSRMNPLQDIRDPSLPPNPQKVILYRPSVTHYLVVLATLCEELPPDGILLIYLAAPGSLEACSPAVSFSQSSSESKELQDNNRECCLHLGPYVNEGLNCLYPCDLVPFTRKPLFLIIDSNASDAFKVMYGTEKGGAVAMLLSPKSPSFPTGATADSAVSQNGSQFTMFLTAPLQAFCSLLGVANSTIDKKDAYSKAEELLLMILNEWGRALVSSGSLAPIWIEVLGDLFLRRLLLRFIFCRAVLALRSATPAPECLPECLPQLPDCTLPGSPEIQRGVRRLAEFFGIAGQFSLSSDPSPPNSGSGGGGPEDPAI
ncbi:unnamed protein product [Spirodela intermedia]|uniref:Integrase catalytic domain-containing protein n=1 Tax=Spirodela intermedia TaxID=51605 RepID=A0A7I8L994_SPIIN|nr:unnamed protein product [Spirodela intermedia]